MGHADLRPTLVKSPRLERMPQKLKWHIPTQRFHGNEEIFDMHGIAGAWRPVSRPMPYIVIDPGRLFVQVMMLLVTNRVRAVELRRSKTGAKRPKIC